MVQKLPQKGVLFLGGHQNMTKKLHQRYPEWKIITDDRFKSDAVFNQKIVFYWTNHGSHKMMRYVFSKLSKDAEIYYVTATNLNLLETEMLCAYQTAKGRHTG